MMIWVDVWIEPFSCNFQTERRQLFESLCLSWLIGNRVLQTVAGFRSIGWKTNHFFLWRYINYAKIQWHFFWNNWYKWLHLQNTINSSRSYHALNIRYALDIGCCVLFWGFVLALVATLSGSKKGHFWSFLLLGVLASSGIWQWRLEIICEFVLDTLIPSITNRFFWTFFHINRKMACCLRTSEFHVSPRSCRWRCVGGASKRKPTDLTCPSKCQHQCFLHIQTVRVTDFGTFFPSRFFPWPKKNTWSLGSFCRQWLGLCWRSSFQVRKLEQITSPCRGFQWPWLQIVERSWFFPQVGMKWLFY